MVAFCFLPTLDPHFVPIKKSSLTRPRPREGGLFFRHGFLGYDEDVHRHGRVGPDFGPIPTLKVARSSSNLIGADFANDHYGCPQAAFSKARSNTPGTTEVLPFPTGLAASLKRCPDTKLGQVATSAWPV
jgi:hypothetical protein